MPMVIMGCLALLSVIAGWRLGRWTIVARVRPAPVLLIGIVITGFISFCVLWLVQAL